MAILTRRLSEQLSKHYKDLEDTRSKVETLLISGHLNVYDVERVYSGLYLSLFTEFEGTIEKLFLGLLSGRYYSKNRSIQCTSKIKPTNKTQDVVFGGRSYVDWLPYNENTLPRAKRFFLNGEPFTLIDNNCRDNLSDYCTIRNAIAHRSDIAHQRFQNMISSLPILPQERTPAGYLRSNPSSFSPQTQYEIASLELEKITYILCS